MSIFPYKPKSGSFCFISGLSQLANDQGCPSKSILEGIYSGW